jgi:predicted O-methyltransferase YrrM
MSEISTKQYQFTVDWFSNHTKLWSRLFSGVIPNSRKILEIGSYEGRSAVWLLESVLHDQGGEIYCVDTWEGGEEHENWVMSQVEKRFDENAAIALASNVNCTLHKLKGTSRKWLAELKLDGHSGTFDFIYVDGSHQAPDVLEDLTGAFPLCRLGGIILCDDYLWEMERNPLHTPKLAIDAFVTCFRSKITILPAPLYQVVLVKTAD